MKKAKKILLFAIITFLIITSISYAENDNKNEKVEAGLKKSEEYKKWESLTNEEKENNIMPNYSNISIDSSVKKSTLNNLLKEDMTSLPSSYNLGTILQNIKVKNQRHTASCWAFAFTSMMETTMANKYKKDNLEYSPMHIDYKTSQFFNRKVGEGGSPYIALAYAASGLGPVYEEHFPFDSVYDEEKNNKDSYYLSDIKDVNLNQEIKEQVKDTTYFANIFKSYADDSIEYKDSLAFFGYNKYTDEQVDAMRNLIKQHIKEDGAVTATFYADSMAGLTQNGEYRSIYFNNEKNAYYFTGILSANHAVTIVGWDDNYKKENFSSQTKQPIHDGAYIVLNSWGTEFADNGYFYVSYDDAVIEQQICSINKVEEIKEENNKLYEYDELGMNYEIYSINEEKTKYLDSGYAANIFSRDTSNSSEYEYLSEVGVYLFNTEGIEIYVNPNDDDLNDCVKVASYIGSNALEAGYHTIKLNSPLLLKENKFVIKIKYINSQKASIPLECNYDDSKLTDGQTASIYAVAKSNKGESFVSTDGTKWNDLFDYQLDSDITLKNTNACIKAITMITDTPLTISVTGLKVDKTNINMEVGNTENLIATIEPTYATNQNIIWKSDDESIVTVSDTGILKALKKGKTTITATTVDGNYSTSCEVTVTEKTNKEDDVYIPKEDQVEEGTEKIENIDQAKQNIEDKQSNVDKQSIQTETEKDNTIATKILPFTGKGIAIFIVILGTVGLIIAFVKYRKMKDIK